MIKKGDRVYIKKEWQDPGDEKIEFRAAEDEDGGRILIEAHLPRFYILPTQRVRVDMLEAKNG